MDELSPEFLLTNQEVVAPVAPWCVWLDNVELGILLLAQPWFAVDGLRRAELERRLDRLDLPLGPLYFQRVNRAVAGLQERGQIHGLGPGRSRRFKMTPEGFAGLILNLQMVRGDPTIDGSEFELKRALVAACNLVMERAANWPAELDLGGAVADFFDQVEEIQVWGRPVVSDRVVAEAFDVLRLIDHQRQRILALMSAAEGRLRAARVSADLLRTADSVRPGARMEPKQGRRVRDLPGAVDMMRAQMAGEVPELAARADVARYQAYFGYLDHLTAVYSERFRVVDFATFRRVVGGRSD